MKATKPEDERYFKDIVLNGILEEIANENGDTLQKTSSKPKKRRVKRIVWLPLLAILATLSIAFYTQDSNDIKTPTNQALSTQKPLIASIEKPKKTESIRQKTPSGLMIQESENSHIVILKKPAKTLEKQTQQSQREIAKAQLLQQMKN